MADADWWNNPLKIRFLNLRTRTTLTGIYNPETLRVSEQAEYAEIKIPGGPDSYYQWINGGAMSIPLTLFLNEYGEGIQNRRGYVDEAITFFRDAMSPKPVTYGGRIVKTAPDVLRLFWGQMTFGEPAPGLNVIIAAMDTEIVMADKFTIKPVRAFVDLELKRFTFI